MKAAINRLVFCISILTAIAFVIYAMVCSLPESTIAITKIRKIQATSILPEGWGFFTKNPQDDDVVVYSLKKTSENKFASITIPTGSPSNVFGLNRVVRLQSQEIGNILGKITDTMWMPISGTLKSNENFIGSIKPIKLDILSKYPYFKGQYVLQKISPIPWAWYNSFNFNYRKSKIIVIDLDRRY